MSGAIVDICTWCDTEYAFTGGTTTRIEDVLTEVRRYPTRYICVTGGEPLAQKTCLPLLRALCDAGYDVCLETSGALDITSVDSRVARIMDLKAPSSGETAKNLLSKSDLFITEVAFDAGFEDPNYLTPAFKKTEGLTPKQYQQKVHQSSL